jgi:hypothetical protein
MNKLLYNNKNGCFKICNTCKDNDKLYKYVETIIGYDTPVIYTEFTKKNEVTKLMYSFAPGDPSNAKTDGKYWYVWDEDYNKWFVLANVDTNFNSNNNRSQWRTIIKCAN